MTPPTPSATDMSSDALALCLDTTSKVLMIALGNPKTGEVFFRYQEPSVSQRYHSALLVPVLQDALARLSLSPQALTHLAVNIGPGSFTGIRTGLTAIRTLAQFLEVSVYAFNTFELLCGPPESAPENLKETAVFLDALQGLTYCAVLKASAHQFHYSVSPSLMPLEAAKTLVQRPDIRILTAERLAPSFSGLSYDTLDTLETLNPFTPAAMLRWLPTHGETVQKPWPSVLPLYLQEPNITQRHPQAGTLK